MRELSSYLLLSLQRSVSMFILHFFVCMQARVCVSEQIVYGCFTIGGWFWNGSNHCSSVYYTISSRALGKKRMERGCVATWPLLQSWAKKFYKLSSYFPPFFVKHKRLPPFFKSWQNQNLYTIWLWGTLKVLKTKNNVTSNLLLKSTEDKTWVGYEPNRQTAITKIKMKELEWNFLSSMKKSPFFSNDYI